MRPSSLRSNRSRKTTPRPEARVTARTATAEIRHTMRIVGRAAQRALQPIESRERAEGWVLVRREFPLSSSQRA